MPDHHAALTRDTLGPAVHSIVAEVLFITDDEVADEKSLVLDLGAESIDFLDLVFRLEDILEKRITIQQFDRWVRERLGGAKKDQVTVALLTEFAMEEAERPND